MTPFFVTYVIDIATNRINHNLIFMQHLNIIPIVGCLMIFGIVYVVVTAWNRRNIAMIEAGMNPSSKKEKKHSQLRIALLMICVPVGILVGNLIHGIFDIAPEPAAIIFSFLFGGVALTATYFIENKTKNPFEEEE